MPADDADAVAEEKDDLIGKVLDGRYRVDRVLGSGGMGHVYFGHHLGIDRDVAIKVLHTEFGASRTATQRFQREALASGRLDHPNIITVSDFGVLDDGRCYLVMEALQGESLETRLDRDGAIPWRGAFDIIRSVLRGLRHAHERGVVHRDIKPDNIFLAIKDGEMIVKVLDFGIAKLFAGTADDPTATRAGLTIGTPAYLSPEQAVGGTITPASDLYSTSVVLFELLTGHAPFEGETAVGMMVSHISATPPRLLQVAPGIEVPPGVEELVQRGLAKMPADRFASAGDYLAELDSVHRAADPEFAARVPLGRDSAPIPIPRIDSGSAHLAASAVPRASSAYTPQPELAYAGTLDAIPMSLSAPALSPEPRRAPSISHPSERLPRRWLPIGGGVLAVAAVIGTIAIVTGGNAPTHSTGAEPPTPQPSIAPLPASIPPPTRSDADREIELKALLHDLKTGTTCADRRAVIPKLVELGDTRVIPALKAARYRMRGGVLGIGAKNANACLKADAEAAMRALSPKP